MQRAVSTVVRWPRGSVLARSGLLLLALGLAGCGGDAADAQGAAVVATANADLPAGMVERSWPVEMATAEAQQKLVGASEGWVTLVMNRNYKLATKQLGGAGGLGAARAHSEAAGLYRQAALIAAHSFIETYGNTPQPTDPAGTAHLLAVSYALTGEIDKARAESAKLDAADPTQPWHGPWKTWLAQPEPVWPPDLAALPMQLPAVTPGEWPDAPTMPHYSLLERGESTSTLDMADPGALVALALWHDAAAQAAAGDKVGLVHTYGARYRMPIEAGVAGELLPIELLFGADLIVPEDGPFLAAALGEQGIAAVDAHKDKSVLAAMADRARVDGKISPERAIDLAAGLRAQLIAAAKAKNGGTEDSAHRTFADIAQVGALRSLALVVEVEGNHEGSGVLRINAMEKSDAATACPNGLLSLAAWDAGNRYPGRGTEILHQMIRRYPSLEAARYGLDVLALRVSRERVQLPPGM